MEDANKKEPVIKTAAELEIEKYIPKQLQNPEFKFVLLGKCNEWGRYEIVNGKRKLVEKKIFPFEDYSKLIKEKIWEPLGKAPFESAWQNKGYKYNDPKVINHLKSGKNIGAIGGKGRLIMIDIDNSELAKETLNKVDTYCEWTGTKGLHAFFTSDYDKNSVLVNKSGEIRANNYQVVCGNMRHPNGEYYKVAKDLPIKEISKEDFFELIKPLLKKDIEENIQQTEIQYENKDTSRSGLEYRKIVSLLKQGKTKEEIFSEMMAYSKWAGSPEQYRNHQYDNALKFIDSEHSDEILKFNKIKEIENIINSITEQNKEEKTKLILTNIAVLDLGDLETENLLEKLARKTNYKPRVLQRVLRKEKVKVKNNTVIKEKIDFAKKNYDRTELKDIVVNYLLKHDISSATEILCQEILKKEHIHTTRDDEKSEVWIYQEGIYIPNGRTYIKEFCRLVLEESYSSYIANLVISKIEADTYIDAKEFFKESPVDEIPVRNGILNIFERTLSSFTPEKRFFTKIPVNYIPLADCPLIKKFLSQIHKHEDDIPVIQELIGYCLLRDYRIEKAFMMSGDGRNGKGRELEILKRFLGGENCVNIQLQDIEKDNFALSEFHGKLANISGDISKEALNHTGNFKMLTGEDLITANRKFKVRISFLNYAKQIYSANETPKTYDLTDAFFLRWVLLEYPYKFLSQKELDKLTEEERNIQINNKSKYNLADKEIVSKITTDEELTGLLNWALEGLSRLLQKRDFSYSKSMAEVKNMWIRKSDSFQAFCMDEIEPQYDGIITKDELRRKYNEYCRKHNVPAMGDKNIKETLTREYGVTECQKTISYQEKPMGDWVRKVSYVWEGIKFKQS